MAALDMAALETLGDMFACMFAMLRHQPCYVGQMLVSPSILPALQNTAHALTVRARARASERERDVCACSVVCRCSITLTTRPKSTRHQGSLWASVSAQESSLLGPAPSACDAPPPGTVLDCSVGHAASPCRPARASARARQTSHAQAAAGAGTGSRPQLRARSRGRGGGAWSSKAARSCAVRTAAQAQPAASAATATARRLHACAAHGASRRDAATTIPFKFA